MLDALARHVRGNVVAYLALMVALGGTSYAATKLEAGSVGTRELKANAVNASKVKDGTLTRKDLATGVSVQGPQGVPGPQGAPGANGAPGQPGTIAVKPSTGDFTTTSTTYVDVPGAALTLHLPAGGTIAAFFTAESLCFWTGAAGGDFNWCGVRILIGNIEANPANGDGFAFDNPNNKNDFKMSSWQGLAVSRSRTGLPAGSYIVQVQTKVKVTGMSFNVGDWHLTAMGAAG